MRRDCTEPATCMVGLAFYVDPVEAAECAYPVDKPVATASTGLLLCAKHYTIFHVDGSAAMLLAGEAVKAAMDVCERSSGFTLDRPRAACIQLALSDPAVTFRDQAVHGFINRPFAATVPTGVWLN